MTDLLSRDGAVDRIADLVAVPSDSLTTAVLPCASNATLDMLGVGEDAGYTSVRSQLGRLANRRTAMRDVACGGPTMIVIEDNGREPVEPLAELVRDLSTLRRHAVLLVVSTTGDPARFDAVLPKAA